MRRGGGKAHLPPRQLAQGSHGDSNSGVEMSTGNPATDQNPQHHTKSPSGGITMLLLHYLILDFREFEFYPQLTEKKSPLLPRDKTDWATEALPKVIRIKVPALKSNLGIGSNDNNTMNVLRLIE